MDLPTDVSESFRSLHVPGSPLLMPNPWDAGSARILQHLGFRALATTSFGFAGSVGRHDGNVTLDEALGHAAEIVAAVDVPVSADLENCYADSAQGVAETVRRAIDVGLAGCSIEDYDPEADAMYPVEVAAERVAAAVEAAQGDCVLTARADNHVHGIDDLDDTIARLVAFEEAGAHVLYAPWAQSGDQIRRIVEAVSLPVNVLGRSGATPSTTELAELGVARVSVGSGFFVAAMGELVSAARELLDDGTFEFWAGADALRPVISEAFA